MILADKIINERKKLGWSQEELAEKLDVSRQSVSKWESAQSAPDLNRVLKMAEIFGVSTDYLLKDEVENQEPKYTADDKFETDNEARAVSMEEASSYLSVVEQVTSRIAFGVGLCIISPATLLIMTDLVNAHRISEGLGISIGLAVLLMLVACGVLIFVMVGRRTKPYEYLDKEPIDTAYGVDGMVRELKEKNDRKNTLLVGIGVAICILSAVPLLVGELLLPEIGKADLASSLVAVLLFMVAVGVYFIINGGSRIGAYNKLLQEGEYSLEGKKASVTVDKVASIYWPIATAIYLIWSFVTNDWGITWIVWPIAGVLFGCVSGAVKNFHK